MLQFELTKTSTDKYWAFCLKLPTIIPIYFKQAFTIMLKWASGILVVSYQRGIKTSTKFPLINHTFRTKYEVIIIYATINKITFRFLTKFFWVILPLHLFQRSQRFCQCVIRTSNFSYFKFGSSTERKIRAVKHPELSFYRQSVKLFVI